MTITVGLVQQGDGLVDNDTDYTDSTEHSGDTPEFAFVAATFNESSDLAEPHAGIGLGMFDGSAEYTAATNHADNASTTVADKGDSDALCQFLSEGSSPSREGHQVAASTRFSANTATLDTTNTYQDSNYEHTVLTLAGDANFEVDVQDVNVDDTFTVTVGFEPDLVIFVSPGLAQANISTNLNTIDYLSQIGFALPDEQMLMLYHADDDAQAAAGAFAGIRTDEVLIEWSGGSRITSLLVDNFTATSGGQFDILFNNISAGSALSAGIMALKFGGDETVKMGTLNSPTSAGTVTVSGLGHTPKLVFLLASKIGTINSEETGGSADSWGLGIIVTHDEYCMSLFNDDGADPTNTWSKSSNKAMDIEDVGTGQLFTVEGPSGAGNGAFNAGEFVLDFTDTDSTARIWGYVSIGEPDAAGVQNDRTISSNIDVGDDLALLPSYRQESFRFRNNNGGLGTPA